MAVSLLEAKGEKVLRSLEMLCSKDTHETGLSFDCCKITLEHAPLIASLLHSNALKSLYIRGSELPPCFIETIAKGLPSATSLRELDFRWCSLCDPEATVLARTLPYTNVVELLLGNNNISDQGAFELVKSIARNTVLRIFDFQNNNISTSGASIFKDLFQQNNTLHTVLLDGNKFSLTILQQLIPSIVKNTSVTMLTVPSVVGISSEIKNLLVSVSRRNSLLFELNRLSAVDDVVEKLEEKSVPEDPLYEDWSALPQEEVKTEVKEDPIEIKEEVEDQDKLVREVRALACKSLDNVAFHNSHLQNAVLDKLESISNVIQNDTERKIQRQKQRSNKQCTKMRQRLEKEQDVKHKLESTLVAIDDENTGFLNVLKLKRQEIIEKDLKISALERELKGYRRFMKRSDVRNLLQLPSSTGIAKSNDAEDLRLAEEHKQLEEQNSILSAQVFEQECLISRLMTENRLLAHAHRPGMTEAESEKELERECVICKDHHRSIVFVPCGHLCSCESCSQNLTECPVCRAAFATKCKIYF